MVIHIISINVAKANISFAKRASTSYRGLDPEYSVTNISSPPVEYEFNNNAPSKTRELIINAPAKGISIALIFFDGKSRLH